jgi:hypothetical protein
MFPRSNHTWVYNLRGAMLGEAGGEGGNGIRLAYSTSMIRLRLSMTRSPAAVHTGPTPGCCDNDLLTSAVKLIDVDLMT